MASLSDGIRRRFSPKTLFKKMGLIGFITPGSFLEVLAVGAFEFLKLSAIYVEGFKKGLTEYTIDLL